MTPAVLQWLVTEIAAAARDAGLPAVPIVSARDAEGGGVHVEVAFTLSGEAVETLMGKLQGRD